MTEIFETHHASTPRTIMSSAQWLDYYSRNAAEQLVIPWERGAEVSDSELAEIKASLQAWQLGESSDGSHLLASARAYAARIGDPMFVEAAKLFIREEQRHGDLLGRFLDLAGVPRKTKDWGDSLFRAVRYASADMEVWATPVIMVETIAMLYYRAIHDATGSPVLRAICAQIVSDEVPHIKFQYERLAILQRDRSRVMRAATLWGHRLFFAAVCVAVWVGHARAFRAGGFSFSSYWREAWKQMSFAWEQMNPALYDWGEQRAPAAATETVAAAAADGAR